MRAWILLLIVILTPTVLAEQEPEDLFASETVGIDLTISSDLKLKSKDAKPAYADYVQADLYFFPKQDIAQSVLSLVTTPTAEQRDEETLRYYWDNPPKSFRYEARSTVEIRNRFPRVIKKIPFPITNVPNHAKKYLEPSEHIDSTNREILNLANRLAQGKDDLWIVVSDIAIWTKNNIEYNLSTLTAEVSQKASWVLQERYGVCDELTSLFIAMLRALGIPARFITGVSYTSSPLFPDRWGAHGWAEVYFPGTGWIPFDPTFGEFGWVDPGHVKMMTSSDPTEPSVRFEWRSKNADLVFGEPDIDASITKVGKKIPPLVELTIKPLYEEVGYGSYNLVQATIKNLQPYYMTTELKLARVKELDLLDPPHKQVILRPREKKTVFWRAKVKEGLHERFVYTVPLAIYTIWNETAQSSFKTQVRGGEYTRIEVTRAMSKLQGEDDQVIAQNIDVQCEANKAEIYPSDTASVICTMRNIGTIPLTNVLVCLEDQQCKALDIGIGQTRELGFEQGFTKPGASTLFVTAKTGELSKSYPVPIVMQDVPVIKIKDLYYPDRVKYGQPFSVVFSTEPESYNTPLNVRVTISTPTSKRIFEMPSLPSEQSFEVEMHAKDLSLGTTDIIVEAIYEDTQGKKYTSTITSQIELTDVPFLPKIWLWMRRLFE